MRAELGLPSVKGDDEHGGGMTGGFGGSMGGAQGGKGKRPISVKFEIPYFTTSGIQVRYLKIIEPKVRPCFPCFEPSSAAISFLLCAGAPNADRATKGRHVACSQLLATGCRLLGRLQSARDPVPTLQRFMHASALGSPYAPSRRVGSRSAEIWDQTFWSLFGFNVLTVACPIVAVSFSSMGTIHYAVWGYRCTLAGCSMTWLCCGWLRIRQRGSRCNIGNRDMMIMNRIYFNNQ